MGAQHTPGPWSIVPYGDERNTNLVIHSDPQNRVCFMATPGQNRAMAETAIEANARLIAAAPELYEALEQLLAITDDPANDADSEESVFPFARAALAKARGEQ